MSEHPASTLFDRARASLSEAGRNARQAADRIARQGGHALGRVTDSLRAARDRRSALRLLRPDGTLASPPATPPATGERPLPAPIARLAAPLRGGIAGLRQRWQDALAEGRAAARAKENELRADYEQRVRHNPALHERRPRDPGAS
jgi:hypothetical protein